MSRGARPPFGSLTFDLSTATQRLRTLSLFLSAALSLPPVLFCVSDYICICMYLHVHVSALYFPDHPFASVFWFTVASQHIGCSARLFADVKLDGDELLCLSVFLNTKCLHWHCTQRTKLKPRCWLFTESVTFAAAPLSPLISDTSRSVGGRGRRRRPWSGLWHPAAKLYGE